MKEGFKRGDLVKRKRRLSTLEPALSHVGIVLGDDKLSNGCVAHAYCRVHWLGCDNSSFAHPWKEFKAALTLISKGEDDEHSGR